MVDWRCDFIQSIDSHKKKKSESSTTRGAQEEDRLAEAIIPEHKTTALPELLQSKSISSSITRFEALILGRGLKYILKKGLAEFEQL